MSQTELLMSIDGAGHAVAIHTTIATEALTRFDDPSKSNCCARAAPFSHLSGGSQHSKGCHIGADKVMKRLLHLAAQL